MDTLPHELRDQLIDAIPPGTSPAQHRSASWFARQIPWLIEDGDGDGDGRLEGNEGTLLTPRLLQPYADHWKLPPNLTNQPWCAIAAMCAWPAGLVEQLWDTTPDAWAALGWRWTEHPLGNWWGAGRDIEAKAKAAGLWVPADRLRHHDSATLCGALLVSDREGAGSDRAPDRQPPGLWAAHVDLLYGWLDENRTTLDVGGGNLSNRVKRAQRRPAELQVHGAALHPAALPL